MMDELKIPVGEENFYKKIGETIRSARLARNVSVADLAGVLQVGVDVIEAYENADLAIPIYHFLEIAKFMNWPAEFDELQKIV